MNRAVASLLMAGIASVSISSPAWPQSGKKSSIYYMRKAFCEKEAAAMHFGVHRIKRARYIKKCMSESHK